MWIPNWSGKVIVCCTVVSPLGPPCQDGVFYLFGGTDGAARQSDVHACAISPNPPGGCCGQRTSRNGMLPTKRGRCDQSSDKQLGTFWRFSVCGWSNPQKTLQSDTIRTFGWVRCFRTVFPPHSVSKIVTGYAWFGAWAHRCSSSTVDFA